MIAPTYWRLDEALELIRALQSDVRKFGYHLCLGGGVLNTGKSDKDLDLYFLSLDNQGPSDPDALIAHLENIWSCKGVDIWGSGTTDGGPDPSEVQPPLAGPAPVNPSPYTVKLMFSYTNLRIDVFILGGLRRVKEESDAEAIAYAPPRVNPFRFRMTNERLTSNIPFGANGRIAAVGDDNLTTRQQRQAEEIRAWGRRMNLPPPGDAPPTTGATGAAADTWNDRQWLNPLPISRAR